MSGIVGAATTTGVIVNVSDDGKSDFIEVKQEDLSAAPVGGGSSTNQGVVANSGAAEDQEEEGNLMIVDDAGTHSTLLRIAIRSVTVILVAKARLAAKPICSCKTQCKNCYLVYLQMEKVMTTTRMATSVMLLLTNFPDPSIS